jgi:K+-sensing histidine kinase KdpD
VVSLRIPERFKALLGTILCGTLAFCVSLMGQSKPGKSGLPIWFLAAVMLIVFFFGSLAGVLGTILSAIIFAVYLFEPLGRLAVHDEVQKNNLMWMALVGVVLSLFGRPPDKEPASSKEKS